MTKTERCVLAYQKHRHLKKAGEELGIPWQTVYVHLKKAGIPVVGDKLRYGSDTDRLAARAEQDFLALVPIATDQNQRKFQAKVDFFVNGHGVDVKASTRKKSSDACKTYRWSFSLKKQELMADFFVCFAYSDQMEISHVFLIPGEIARTYTTMSVAEKGRGKWWDYTIPKEELHLFFAELGQKRKGEAF